MCPLFRFTWYLAAAERYMQILYILFDTYFDNMPSLSSALCRNHIRRQIVLVVHMPKLSITVHISIPCSFSKSPKCCMEMGLYFNLQPSVFGTHTPILYPLELSVNVCRFIMKSSSYFAHGLSFYMIFAAGEWYND